MSTPQTPTGAVRQIIRALRKAGYDLDHVYNHEERIHVATEREAIYEVTQAEDAYLWVAKDGERAGWVRFVTCNPEPDEAVADYTLGEVAEVVDPIVDEWIALSE